MQEKSNFFLHRCLAASDVYLNYVSGANSFLFYEL